MASSINPSNSHVLNTLVFNAGQLRKLFSNVTEMLVPSSVSSSFIKRPFAESEIDSTSVITSVPSVKFKYINTNIQATSSVATPVVRNKFINTSITGDTESVLYTVFRRSETDTTSINTTSTLNIPFIVKKVLNTNINSNSIINTISIPVRKLFNTNINNTSNFNINTIKSKLININITGDTEAFSYTVYRDVNTGITPVVTRSTVIIPTIIRHYYGVSNIDNTTSFTSSLSRNIVRYSDIESVSSTRVIIPTTIFTDISSITASTDSSITTKRRRINSSSIINTTSIDSSTYKYRTFSSTIEECSSVKSMAGRNKYTQSSFVDISDVHLEQSGFLLYYKGRLKMFICPQSSPHHPEGLEYKVRGIETKERYPLNSFILGDIILNDGGWTTSSYHFDTAETIKENTIFDIHEIEEPVVVECDNKHSFFFTPTTKSSRISLTPVVGKELKYNGHKIFE